MLAGGKEINYLMLNGEVFGAENNFPCFYKFAKSESVNHSPNYYMIGFDNQNNIIMEPGPDSNASGGGYMGAKLYDKNKELVMLIIQYKNEKYALADCNIGNTYSRRATVWIKMSDFGGGTFLSKIGGVNSPSYLLLIYYIGEVVPYVG